MGSREALPQGIDRTNARKAVCQLLVHAGLAWAFLFSPPGTQVAHAQEPNPDLCPNSPALTCVITPDNHLQVDGGGQGDLLRISWSQIVPAFCPDANGGEVYTAFVGYNGIEVVKQPNGTPVARFKEFGTDGIVCKAPLEALLNFIDVQPSVYSNESTDRVFPTVAPSPPPKPTEEPIVPALPPADPAQAEETVIGAIAKIGYEASQCMWQSGLIGSLLYMVYRFRKSRPPKRVLPRILD